MLCMFQPMLAEPGEKKKSWSTKKKIFGGSNI
jgi:hypothetical protein